MSLTILTADELQNLEMRAPNQLGADTLMKRAGAAAAELIMKRLEDAGVEQRRVTLLVGPGNNGGDGWVAAEGGWLLPSRSHAEKSQSTALSTECYYAWILLYSMMSCVGSKMGGHS